MSAAGYAAPRSLDEAVGLLANNPSARVLAGGQRLLIEPARSAFRDALLVDLGRIRELSGIEPGADGSLKVGAMTTLGALAMDATARSSYPALCEAARSMGDVQTRNSATVGGSVLSGDPEAVLPAAVMAFDATLHLAALGGTRTVSLADVPTSLGTGLLAAGEVITAVTLPAAPKQSGSGSAIFLNPATLHALCGVVAVVTLDGTGGVAACRIALAGATDEPRRLQGAEAALTGQRPSPDSLAAASARSADGITFRSDVSASADYRAHLTRVLVKRALTRALERAAR